jgi:hypothetical protein
MVKKKFRTLKGVDVKSHSAYGSDNNRYVHANSLRAKKGFHGIVDKKKHHGWTTDNVLDAGEYF